MAISLKAPNARLNRWRLELGEFDLHVKYKRGKEKQVADALPRVILMKMEKNNRATWQKK